MDSFIMLNLQKAYSGSLPTQWLTANTVAHCQHNTFRLLRRVWHTPLAFVIAVLQNVGKVMISKSRELFMMSMRIIMNDK
jgi:hypothetical protein